MTTENNDLIVLNEDLLAKLKDFCKAYSQRETEELFCRATLTLTGGNFPKLHDRKKAALLDFCEALEKIIPALYQVQAMGDKDRKNEKQASEV